MFKIAICEDEEIQAKQIIKTIQKFSKGYQLEYFESGKLLLEEELSDYDLIILDIHIDEMNGIDVARCIRQKNQRVKIVFITAHQQYWPEGYKVLASRYLLKPMSDQQLYDELVEIFEEIKKSRTSIMVKKDKALVKVLIEEVKYLEIFGRKVLVHTHDGIFQSNRNLSYWYKELKFHHFSYTHSSYLVNMKYVKLVERDKVMLVTGDEIYMSLRKYKAFKMNFIRYMSQL